MTELGTAAMQLGCWSAIDNTLALKRRGNDSETRADDFELTGKFVEDYSHACESIGVVPHPQIMRWTQQSKPDENGEAPPVEQLQVFGWTLDLGTATALAATLPSCTTLTTLRFWNAGLTPEVVLVMAKALHGSSVARLHLDWNPFTTDEDASCLSELCSADSSVKVLSLRGNNLTDVAVKPLLDSISNGSSLISLNLGSNELHDSSAQILGDILRKNRCLMSLSLAHNHISDAGLKSLLAALTQFPLEAEEAKEKALFMPRGPKLEDGRASCTGNPVLKNLVISYGNIGEEGVAAAEAALEENTTLARLSLTHNNISITTLKRLSEHNHIVVEHVDKDTEGPDEGVVEDNGPATEPKAAPEQVG